MVAYDFSPRFIPLIQSGAKRQTIRMAGKRSHAKTGDKIQLYTGMRTPQCRKIMDDQECTAALPVTLDVENQFGSLALWVGSDRVKDLHEIARADGFMDREGRPNINSMWQFFHRRYGAGEHNMLLIKWAPPIGGLL